MQLAKLYNIGLIGSGDVWMQMIASQNLTSHTYDESTADEIFLDIIHSYYPEFEAFDRVMMGKLSINDNQTELF